MNEKFECFDWAASFYDFTRGIPDDLLKKAFTAMKERIELKFGSKILDVGIGTGRVSIPLLKELSGLKVQIFGIDISEKMLLKCLEKTSSLNNIELVRADGYFLPFSKEFEVIITSHILHLVADPFKFVKGLLRLLKGYYINLEVYVNYHSTLPFQIYYDRLNEEGFQHRFQDDRIRKELTIFLHKQGWQHSFCVLESDAKILSKDLIRFIRDRVFRHQRKIQDHLHFKVLKYLYQEIETRNIDLTSKINVPATAKFAIFYQE
jgi:ubiquinone/menaquinone biosynthesis C-methylase UbiE